MVLRILLPPLRNLHNVISQHATKFNGLLQKSFPIKNDFFDTVTPLEEIAEKEVRQSCNIRKAKGTITEVDRLLHELNETGDEIRRTEISRQLREELRQIPNRTHPTVLSYGNVKKPVELSTFGEMNKTKNAEFTTRTEQKLKKVTKGKLVDSATVCAGLNLMRKEKLGQFCGSRSYYLLSDLAELVIFSFTQLLF